MAEDSAAAAAKPPAKKAFTYGEGRSNAPKVGTTPHGDAFFAALGRDPAGEALTNPDGSPRGRDFSMFRKESDDAAGGLDRRFLRGLERRWAELGGSEGGLDCSEFEALAQSPDAKMSPRGRPNTPREARERRRRAEALARIAAAGRDTGRAPAAMRSGPACGRRAASEVKLDMKSFHVNTHIVDRWTPRQAAAPGFPFSPRDGRSPPDAAPTEPGEEASNDPMQIEADRLRTLAASHTGELSPEQQAAALAKRQEELKMRVMTPDNWRCKTSAVTGAKPAAWNWTGVAGSLHADDPKAVSATEDPRWSERALSLTEICASHELDAAVLRRAAAGSTAESWSTPDDTGCTALQALCGNSSLHQAALEVALEHATSSSCWLAENAATWQTAMHLLCANASAMCKPILARVLHCVAMQPPFDSRTSRLEALWTAQDMHGMTPLHHLCVNTLKAEVVEAKDLAEQEANLNDVVDRAEEVETRWQETGQLEDEDEAEAEAERSKVIDDAAAHDRERLGERLCLALGVAVGSAPVKTWQLPDSNGRLPLHHLLENPVLQSAEGVPVKAFAEIEHRIASVGRRDTPAAQVGQGACVWSMDGGFSRAAHAAKARGRNPTWLEEKGAGERRAGRTSATLGLGQSERREEPEAFAKTVQGHLTINPRSSG